MANKKPVPVKGSVEKRDTHSVNNDNALRRITEKIAQIKQNKSNSKN